MALSNDNSHILPATTTFVESKTNKSFEMHETFQQRFATEGWWLAIGRPAAVSILFWVGVFLLLLCISFARQGFSVPTFVFFLIASVGIGFLSTLSRQFWGRTLELSEDGSIVLKGRRDHVIGKGMLSRMPDPVIEEQWDGELTVLGLEFPDRKGQLKIRFTTRISETERQELIKHLKCQA